MIASSPIFKDKFMGNWGSGFIVQIIYSSATAITDQYAILTEDNKNLLTEDSKNIDVEN